ncbi:MAG: hypothetical protein JWM10_789 [Myxococcaceae bacterium]|nr:hypothetical protein [Myxococcaceae bacterium]
MTGLPPTDESGFPVRGLDAEVGPQRDDMPETTDVQYGDGSGNALHGMIPGSHERPDGPECRCGRAWLRWDDRCESTSLDGRSAPDREGRDVASADESGDPVQRLSTTNLTMIAEVCEALSAPRNQSYWRAPDVIPLVDPNGGPVGRLVWDSQRHDYSFHIGGER